MEGSHPEKTRRQLMKISPNDCANCACPRVDNQFTNDKQSPRDHHFLYFFHSLATNCLRFINPNTLYSLSGPPCSHPRICVLRSDNCPGKLLHVPQDTICGQETLANVCQLIYWPSFIPWVPCEEGQVMGFLFKRANECGEPFDRPL